MFYKTKQSSTLSQYFNDLDYEDCLQVIHVLTRKDAQHNCFLDFHASGQIKGDHYHTEWWNKNGVQQIEFSAESN